MSMIPLFLLAAVAASGADSSPAGVAAVQDILDVGSKFCVPLMRDKPFDIKAALETRGFGVPGMNQETGPHAIAAIFKRPNNSMVIIVHTLDNKNISCTVVSEEKVWDQLDGKLPTFAKASGLTLRKLPYSKMDAFKSMWVGDGLSVRVGANVGNGTSLDIGRW